MRRTALAAAALLPLLVAPATRAQTVRGNVLEDGTKTPIVGATIELLVRDSVAAAATSDSTGWFELEPEKPGTFTVRPSHPSFAAVRSDTLTAGKGEIVTITIHMGRAAIPLEPLVVTARARDRLEGFRQRVEHGGMGRYLQREDFEKREGMNVTDVLRMTPGVQIVPVARGVAFHTNIITLRGCRANVFIDGMPVRQYDDSGVDELLTPEMIEGAEIYASPATAPAELMAPFSDCGVVALWTRGGEGGRPFSWKRLGIAALLVGALVLLMR